MHLIFDQKVYKAFFKSIHLMFLIIKIDKVSIEIDFQTLSNGCFHMNHVLFSQVKDPRSRHVAGVLKKQMFFLIVFQDGNFNWLLMCDTMQCKCINSSQGSSELSTLKVYDVVALIHFALIKSDLPIGFSFLPKYREKYLSLKER